MSQEQPNIVLCMCDQLRAFEVGCYGNDHIRTPNIDRLASSGARFDLAVTPNPVCTPARSSTLTGQYSRTCAGMLGNVHRNPANPARERLLDPTLPEILRENGYHTELIGKWHIGPQPKLIGFNRAVYPKVAHRYYDQTYFTHEGDSFVVEEFGPHWEMQRVREFLAGRREEDEPFFLFHNISLPHQPIGRGHMPDRYVDMYDPDKVPIRPNAMEDGEPSHDRFWFNVYTSADFFWRHIRDEEQHPRDIVPEDFDLNDLTALYYGATTCVDDLLGDLMDALEENGLDENTIVVFVSDHGDNLGSHGMFNKNSLIEEAIRVPLIVRDPRKEPRENETDLSNLIDIAPTLLDLSGIGKPEHMQGNSLVPLMEGECNPDDRDFTFIETGSMIGVRTRTHLYGLPFDEEAKNVTDGGEWFYDLRNDPYEMNNLGGTNQQEGVRRTLRRRLLKWHQTTPWLDAPKAERFVE